MNAKISMVETMINESEKAKASGDLFGANKAAQIAYREAVSLFEAYENDELAIDNTQMDLMSKWAERLGKLIGSKDEQSNSKTAA